MTDLDVRYYIFQLLIALDYCHSRGIMHRWALWKGGGRGEATS